MPRRRRVAFTRKIRLTVFQVQTLITIQVELGVAGVVSVVLPVLFDKGSWQVLVLGVLFSAGEKI